MSGRSRRAGFGTELITLMVCSALQLYGVRTPTGVLCCSRGGVSCALIPHKKRFYEHRFKFGKVFKEPRCRTLQPQTPKPRRSVKVKDHKNLPASLRNYHSYTQAKFE